MKKLLILALLSSSTAFAVGGPEFTNENFKEVENRRAEAEASRECIAGEFSEQLVKEKCTCERLNKQSSLVKAELNQATKAAQSVLSSCENSGARDAYGWAVSEKDFSTVNWLIKTGQVLVKAGRVVSAGCETSSVVTLARQAFDLKKVALDYREQRIAASKEVLGCE